MASRKQRRAQVFAGKCASNEKRRPHQASLLTRQNASEPLPELLARLEDVVGDGGLYRTDRNGTIEFISDGESLWVTTQR